MVQGYRHVQASTVKMKISIKTMIYIVLLSLLANAALFSFAASVHDDHMAYVLFGKRAGVYKRSEKTTALAYASYLAIDQFNGKGEEKLSYLRDKTKVRGLPASISTFDFSNNSGHRKYTHMGWDYVYAKGADEAKWKTRKSILVSTTMKVFSLSSRQEQRQADSLSALIYYVHVLGDHIDDKTIKLGDKMDFAGRNDKNSIARELEKHVKILFKSQKNSFMYRSLLKRMEAIDTQALRLASKPGGPTYFTEEEFKAYKNLAEELMKALTDHVPQLLQNEQFFRQVFP